jgi:hypothetical protein
MQKESGSVTSASDIFGGFVEKAETAFGGKK